MMNLIRTWMILSLAFTAGAPSMACTAPSPQAAISEPTTPNPAVLPAPRDDLVQRGWVELSEGRAAEAEKTFERALAQDAQSTEARVGLIRSWIAEARINDAVDTIDKLDHAAFRRSDIDYLFGMAFAQKAHVFIRQSVPAENINMAFADAATSLGKATTANPDAYKDAYAPLAEATWFLQDLPAARAAADRAIVLQPLDPESRFILGRVALAQYVAAQGEDAVRVGTAADNSEAEADWKTARSAFEAAIEIASRKPAGDAPAAELKVRALVELGNTLMWKQAIAEAAHAYTGAMAIAPAQVEFAKVRSTLGADLFAAALEEAMRRIADREPVPPGDKALLLWWLGYVRFEQQKYAEAEAAFVAAVDLVPSYVNSWFYAGLARFHQKNYHGATAAFLRNWSESAPDLVAALRTNPEANLAIVDALVGWCVEEERTLDAAVLSDMQAEAMPELTRYWNNAGLFYRDVGEQLVKSGQPEDMELARENFEHAYVAYSSALALSPEDPAILNDTGVMLHYCLKRDFGRAKELYRKANMYAKAALARADLAADTRALYETALRDSTNNLKLLEKDAAKSAERPGGL